MTEIYNYPTNKLEPSLVMISTLENGWMDYEKATANVCHVSSASAQTVDKNFTWNLTNIQKAVSALVWKLHWSIEHNQQVNHTTWMRIAVCPTHRWSSLLLSVEGGVSRGIARNISVVWPGWHNTLERDVSWQNLYWFWVLKQVRIAYECGWMHQSRYI